MIYRNAFGLPSSAAPRCSHQKPILEPSMPKTKGPPWPLREKGCCLDLGWGVWGWRWCCCSEFSLGCCLASHHLRRQGVGLPCLGLFLELSPRIKSERRKKRPAGAAGNEFNDEVWPEFKLILQMSSHRVGQGGCPLGPWPASWAAAPAFSSVVPSLRLDHLDQASGSGEETRPSLSLTNDT